ncbi:ABC transporter substrate-binding protein [Microcoleus sp. T2B6]|uniref:caspase, EACC1-associated type n=1 Tax=Microcoleus sp. T2B6 TaxID=3055424 RepID=UPI002FD40211
MPKKIALLIGVSEYGQGIPPLSAPPNDVEAIRRVLADPNLGGFDEVKPLINPDLTEMQIQIEWLFDNREKQDVLVLFFSGHGIINDHNRLYLTTRITTKNNFRATAVQASFVQDKSRDSRAKRQVMILDCCYSGAFADGWQTKSVGVDIRQELGAEGRAVLTSSTATQTSFGGEELSLYTQHLVDGINTGAADTDNNGEIQVWKLHDYAKRKVQDVRPNQKPGIISDQEGFKILLARVPMSPEAQYRQIVERYARNGKISTRGLLILPIKRQELGIADDKAAEIEKQVLEPFHQRLNHLGNYQEAFKEAVKESYPLTQIARYDLRYLQDKYGLRDEDVAPIEEEVVGLTVPPSQEDPPKPKPGDRIKQAIANIFRTPIAVIPVAILGIVGVGYPVIKFIPSSEDICQSQFFSCGEETFFPSKLTDNKAKGLVAFQKKQYKNATDFFESTIIDYPNDPESKIYLNNARALSNRNPVTLAVVVPILETPDIAEEILRGVAQAQHSFNTSRKEGLLQIVIANDNNNRNQAKQVAQKLSQYSSIIGVIGHYTSAASEAALDDYKTRKLATISPGSTKTQLKSEVFFRTLPNDAKNGEELANYAIKNKYKKVFIFNNPEDPYSRSLTEEFTRVFTNPSRKVVNTVKIDLTEPSSMKITQVDNQQLDAVVLFPSTENTDIASAQNIQNMGIKNLPLLGADALYKKKIFDPGNAVEGLVLAVPWFRDEPNSKDFAKKAKEMWRGEISWRTATSYDATQAFIKALSWPNNPSRQTVLENLKSPDFSQDENSGNSLKFMDGERQEQKPALVKVVRDSSGNLKFELVTK